ncbi:MAG: TetR/AcrR family transcriptional regulator [Chloroflexota bacterium]|nr:TetR/AcrR family transcriptional regulator [Chloroflexota bacterium]
MARPQQISADNIKTTARQQMNELGTAGLTLRGIARTLDVTAPAIYNYFACLDDLITALIVDAYLSVADAMDMADAAEPTDHYAARLTGILRAYRTWALSHRMDFQLIFGNPIPGYKAPGEITIPAAIRASTPFTRPIAEAMLAGHVPPTHLTPPPTIQRRLDELLTTLELSVAIPSASLYYGLMAWSRAHGAIMLELQGHLIPIVGDADAYYNGEIRHLLDDIGL